MLSIFKFIFNPDWFTFSFGGGGGPSTTKTETSNIPEYAQPYVERMMGATEKQIYTYGPKGQITGFQPFQSYSEFDKARGGTGETVAGFTPMQAAAMKGIGAYQLPGQTEAASQMTSNLAGRALQAGQYQPGTFGNFYNAPSPYQTGSFGVGDVGVGTFTRPGTAEAYMSPYQQAVTDIEKRELARQSAIEGQRQQAQAVQAGAFGGSRQGLIEAERQRNLMQQMGDVQARGSQNAFQQAREQFNAENLQAGLQAALANQQARMQEQQAREQSRQFGYGQGMTASELGARYGLSGAELGEKSRQFGAGLGMQGIEQARAAAGQLGALGEQEYKQEMGLLGQQYDVGAKQQQYEQARLNQIIQDYATKQQYPFIQLGTLSNMLRGLPMQASTTQLYQAQPPALQQGIGLAGAYANLKQAGVNMPFKEGGDVKEMASGGIASGVDRYKLPGMVEKLSDQQLEGKLGGDTDPETMGIAQAEKQRRDHIRKGMAGGGAVAFKDGEMVKNPMLGSEEPKKEEPKKEAPAVATRPKAAAPKPAPVEKSPYQAEFKRASAEPSPVAPEVASLRKQQAEEQATVDLGIEGLMDRRQAAYKKYGIDPEAIFRQERADNKRFLEQAQGDARKAEYLRWAQMWAKFGSTPGPILKAALTSINETVPDLLDDQKYATNLQRSIQKTLHEIDRAEYLDKKGNYDEAQKLLNEARGRVANLSIATSKIIADEHENRQKNLAGLASTELKGEFDVKEARIRAAATGGGSEFKQTKEERLLEQAIDKAYKDETKTTQEKLARWKSAPEAVQQKNAATIASLEEQLRTKRAEIEARYRKQEAEKPKTLPPPTAEDIAHTAKRYGVSEEEVRKRLGI